VSGGVGEGRSHVSGGVGGPTRKWTGFGIMGPTCQHGGLTLIGTHKVDPHVRVAGGSHVSGGVGAGRSHVSGGVGGPTRKWTGFGIMGPTCQHGGLTLIGTHMSY
jgi:hypothetical protein